MDISASPSGSTNDRLPDGAIHRLEVIPLGNLDIVAAAAVAAYIQNTIGLTADVKSAWPDPVYSLTPSRNQYNALPILDRLVTGRPPEALRLGLIAGDLYLPIMAYILGEAQVIGRVAVVSAFRLRNTRDHKPVLTSQIYERLSKLSLHVTGHILGLHHCRDDQCLMNFSPGVKQIDLLPFNFCAQCEEQIQMAYQQPE